MAAVKELKKEEIVNELKNKAYYYGALLYVFGISFPQKMATFCLIAWLLLSLISFKGSNKVANKVLLLLPFLYFTYLVGFVSFEIIDFKILETKLSFLAYPLIFYLNAYSDQQREKMLQFFVMGLLVSAVACLLYATNSSIGVENGEVYFKANVEAGKGFMESILYGGNYFFGKHLSIFHQTVYYALYLCAGIIVLLFRPKIFKRVIRLPLLALFCSMVFLVSNKASFIALGVIIMIYLLTLKIEFGKKALGAFLALASFTVLVLTNPRTKESVKKIANGELELNKNARYGFTTRLLSWDAAVSLIKEQPIVGYGTTDTQAKLNERYKQKEYVFPLKEAYNAHNLWLQTWLENGILGLFGLGMVFFVGFKIGFQQHILMGLMLSLIAILFVNSLFESMFHRFSGISFFSFVFCYVLTSSKKAQSKI